ncbi:zinc-binding dehydrogenase [Epidermidibacterium keratini]|uniref:Zinc-binding dehydrogenase n=1 Tax=Epidermidibacterium keratini TaxID=1891644 RepID=A0A7L4YSW5_9ACTN|nr:NADPH:quinone oxidoreductase family protein [Epidermidibacterium keratini]QHC02073.1 zinc-binding dehydrogenase [Epidermidibacterium keratini]
MKAWIVERNGDPADVLTWADVPDVSPGPGQIKVRVTAAALNFPDILLAQGKYQVTPTLPFTPGVEVAGEVVELGEGVTNWKVGDRVFGGPHSDAGAGGGYQEFALMSADDAFAVPEGMPDEKAAGYLLTYQTSWVALHTRGQITEGDWVLVHAGAGGVGSAAIQIAKAAGAKVIATAGGPDKKQVCLDLGADVAVDYNSEDFVAVVKDVTDGHGADIVYDPVGGDVYDKSTKCIAFEGRILIIGFTSGRMAQAATNHLLVKNYSAVGVHWGYYRKMRPEVIPEADAALAKLYAGGQIDPYISRTYSFSELPEALTALGSRKTTGKVVVVPD